MPIPLLSVTHVNVNCTDLAASAPFYRELLGLEESVRTHPDPQDGAAFGLSGEVQWDAAILHDPRGFAGPAVDLLEWKRPAPVAGSAGGPGRLGFASIGFGVPEIDPVFERAQALGARCVAPPAEVPVDPGRNLSFRIFHVLDPDDTWVEVCEQRTLSHPQLSHATLSCSDLGRSREWYEAVLGLEVFGGAVVSAWDGTAFGQSGEVAYEQHYLRVPGREEFGIDLIQWQRPAPTQAPSARANQLGIFRMAFLVENVAACVEGLREQGVACPDPVFLDMGPTIPVDGVWAVFFSDPDGACLELIQTPS